MTMMCKINKLEKPGRPQGNFHALFGRSPTFYGHFRAHAVTSECPPTYHHQHHVVICISILILRISLILVDIAY